MRISGFEKLTLTDYPGMLACIIFTQGCNFKCPFCQNSPLINIKSGEVDENYVFDYLNKRRNILEGVVISGGEPTVQKDLVQFIEKIKKLGFKVKLDTNGSNCKILKELLDKELLDYVAMDIKNDFNSYDEIIGVHTNIKNINESINLLKNSNIDYEFRTTIVREFHNVEKIRNILKIVDGSKYFIQNFQDSDNVLNRSLHGFTNDELLNLAKEFKDIKNLSIRGL